MNLKKLFVLVLCAASLSFQAFASGHLTGIDDPLTVTFIKDRGKLPDYALQQQLRKSDSWMHFLNNHGHWNVIYDENSAMPHRAFGVPVPVSGVDATAAAMNFMTANLSEFRIPMNDLHYVSTSQNNKFKYVNYTQKYQGLDVLFSAVQIKMTHDYRVMQFALDCFPDLYLNTIPQISQSAAVQAASVGVNGIEQVDVTQDLKILPVPAEGSYEYRLVYEMVVHNRDAESIPGKYYTLVDAANGKILYRRNQVAHVAANTDVNVSGTLYLTHPYDPSTVEPIRNLKIVEAGTTYYTDNTGYLGLGNASPTTATVSLEGRWVRVRTNNVTPSWSVSLNPGANNLNIDANTDIKQRTTYNSVNTIHDYMKTKYPTFTQMDNALPANVDVAGSCNAFYDGSSINFYAAGGQCNATSLVVDVCYHEYGHGINDKFYQSQGYNFQNGAMGEGYADIWALGITDSPILGIGFYSNNATGFVRRYDINKKVYPQDLVGQVHADGEIIAGCFWDTYLNLGNLQQMMDLFSQSFYAGITGPDGNEGVIFQDVLLEVLTLDDNDGDITNGTPNFCDITSAFAIHGITLGAAVNFQHTEILQSNPLVPVVVDAVVQGVGSSNVVKGFYRIGNSGAYADFVLNNTGGNNYQGTIPSQPKGTIIEYYLALEDNCGTLTNIIPVKAADANPNIPYYVMVGYDLLLHEDFDAFAGNWITGLPGDDAVTGQWIIDIPIPSYVGTAMVQTGSQNTPGGLFCAFTGNASGPNAGAGENDVDDGKTTLLSPVYDLTSYNNPAFSFYRWYSNDQGATPGTDFWQVAISGDGVNYVTLENTDVSDHGWRRFAFNVADYITPTSTVTIRFIAEDANAGSLVEAAIDDLKLWEEIATGIQDVNAVATASIYPNPASNSINLNIGMVKEEKVSIHIVNQIGQVVQELISTIPAGNNQLQLDTRQLPSGLYQARISTHLGSKTLKFNIMRW